MVDKRALEESFAALTNLRSPEEEALRGIQEIDDTAQRRATAAALVESIEQALRRLSVAHGRALRLAKGDPHVIGESKGSIWEPGEVSIPPIADYHRLAGTRRGF